MATVLMSMHRGICSRLSSASALLNSTRTVHIVMNSPPRVPPLRDPAMYQLGTRASGKPAEKIATPQDFLKSIGRGMDAKVDAALDWEGLWKLNGAELRKAGLAVRDRRYLLWCMEKYRLGFPLSEFVHDPTPKKTIRGWGPKVQNGKRIRSRRIKDKKRKQSAT